MAPTWPDPIFDDTAASSSSTAASSSSSTNSNAIPIDIIVLSDDEDEHTPPSRRRKSRSDDEEHPPPSLRHKYEHWWFPDEVRILTELASLRRKYGVQPPSSVLLDALLSDKPLKRENASAGDVAKKVYALQVKFKKDMAAGGPGHDRRDRRLYELSMEVWGPDLLQI